MVAGRRDGRVPVCVMCDCKQIRTMRVVIFSEEALRRNIPRVRHGAPIHLYWFTPHRGNFVTHGNDHMSCAECGLQRALPASTISYDSIMMEHVAESPLCSESQSFLFSHSSYIPVSDKYYMGLPWSNFYFALQDTGAFHTERTMVSSPYFRVSVCDHELEETSYDVKRMLKKMDLRKCENCGVEPVTKMTKSLHARCETCVNLLQPDEWYVNVTEMATYCSLTCREPVVISIPCMHAIHCALHMRPTCQRCGLATVATMPTRRELHPRSFRPESANTGYFSR